MDMEHRPETPFTHVPIHSFSVAQRILSYFSDADISGYVADGKKTAVYTTLTTSHDKVALNLLGNALSMVAPKAKLILNDENETEIELPVADFAAKPEFPIHQVQRALNLIRDDLVNAAIQHADGSATIDTAKFQHLTPDKGIHLVHCLLQKHYDIHGVIPEMELSEARYELPPNMRFMERGEDPKRPFTGELHTHVDHRHYAPSMAHHARILGEAITEELPAATPPHIEVDKKSFAAMLSELGISSRGMQVN